MVFKTSSWLLSGSLILCLTACGAAESTATQEATEAPLVITEEATATSMTTAEPTDAPTEAPTDEPTVEPTIAATPLPDALAAITLTADDLPDGFAPLTLGQGVDPATLILSDFTVGGAAAFTNEANGEIIISYWVLLDENEQASFDSYIDNDLASKEMIQLALLTGSSSLALSFDPPQTVSGLGDHASSVSVAGDATQELLAFRRGSIGVFVLHVFPINQAPVITTLAIAQLLDQRVQVALTEQ